MSRGGIVDFHGSVIDLPQQRRFGDLASVQRYLDAVRKCSWGHPQTPRPVVRRRRGQARAHWSPPDTVAIPEDAAWAMTELVALHEYAHHVNWHVNQATGHDVEFCHINRLLVSEAMAPAAGMLLLAAYHQSGALG